MHTLDDKGGIESSFRVTYVHKKKAVTVVTKKNQCVVIPFSNSTNSYFIDTFIEFFISLKYFIIFISEKAKHNLMAFQSIRLTLYRDYMNFLTYRPCISLLMGSAFFAFLNQVLPIQSIDYTDEFMGLLNLHRAVSKDTDISRFCKLQEVKIKEISLIAFKSFFPIFLTDHEKDELKYFDINKTLEVPDSPFPTDFAYSNPYYNILIIDKYFTKRHSCQGFPFYYVCANWILFIHKYPPVKSKVTNFGKTLQLEFTAITPKVFEINIVSQVKAKQIQFEMALTPFLHGQEPISNKQVPSAKKNPLLKQFQQEPDADQPNSLPLSKSIKQFTPKKSLSTPGNRFEIIDPETKKVYLHIEDPKTTWDDLVFYISSPDLDPSMDKCQLKQFEAAFLMDNKQLFESDMQHEISLAIDHGIIKSFPNIESGIINLSTLQPTPFMTKIRDVPLHLLMLRTQFLLFLSMVFEHSKDKISTNLIPKFIPYLTKKIKYKYFMKHVGSNNEPIPHVKINRLLGRNIRDGNSEDFTKTVLAQMSKYYTSIGMNSFRNPSDKPWKVKFTGESGIDVGGLARELLTELAEDLSNSNSGLVIPTPNSRNETGLKMQMVIPIPNPKISKTLSSQLYHFAGVVIAICVRTTLVQQFCFPSFVWQYIVDGNLDIQAIFDIDSNYKKKIQALQRVISNNSFDGYEYEDNFVVMNSRGEAIPLTINGQKEKLDLMNITKYISLAHEYRLNELRPHLDAIKDGFWENIDIYEQPLYLDGLTLEYAACGETEISFEDLKKYTVFRIDEHQQDLFWKVIEQLTSEERSLLLQFATGVPRIPPNRNPRDPFLKVDRLSGSDTLPKSSTCFNQFHWPRYSSFEKALKLVRMAISYGGTLDD